MTAASTMTLEQRTVEAYAVLTRRCDVDAQGFTWFDDRAVWHDGVDRVEQLAAHLYQHFYTPGRAIRRATRPQLTRDLQPQYDRIVGESRAWCDGWKVVARRTDAVRITNGAVQLTITPEDVRTVEEERANGGANGVRHQVRLPVLRRRMSPGFCVAAAPRPTPAADLVRIYLSIDAVGAPELLAAFLQHQRALPEVQAKVLSSRSSFDRLDSFVIYLPASRLTAITALLTEVVRDLGGHLRDASPSLTGALAPGIALAAEPTDGGSFGTSVCRVLADALVAGDPTLIPPALHALALRDVAVPPALLASAATWVHVGPSRSLREGRVRGQRAAPADRDAAAVPTDARALVRDIAEVLTTTAITVGDEAMWLWHPPPLPVGPITALATVGPDQYGGTAGIGAFLLAAAEFTGSEQYREVGRMALRHTAARLASGWRRHGAYTGSAGAALVLLRAGSSVVGEDGFEHAVRALLDSGGSMPGEGSPDLLGGVAGTLLMVLRAAELLDEPALVPRAAQLRDRLVTMADGGAGGWPGEDGIALTGFSHGAAGVAYVLHHWLQTTDDSDVRRLLAETVRYEDSHFDAAAANWADLRPLVTSSDDRPRYAQVWCHGSPGIVLARHATGVEVPRSVDVVGRVDALVQEQDAPDPCLCHGLTGLVDITDALAGRSGTRHAALLRQLQRRGSVATWAESRRDTLRPGLMTGLAGIGDHLLRSVTCDTRSPLLP